MKERPVLFRAGAVADAGGVVGTGADACVLADVAPITRGALPVLLASGPGTMHHPLVHGARVVERPGAVIIPGLVNTHTHLDLTAIGPRQFDPDAGFMTWVEMLRSCRQTMATGIRESVRDGIERSKRGGTVAVGDIAGAPGGRPSLTAWEALRESGMLGVSFVEFFSIGKGAERGWNGLQEVVGDLRAESAAGGEVASGVRLGLQPHAPNTVCLESYRRAVKLAEQADLPLSTHLAETWEERRFIGEGCGPQREFLERLGLWDEAMLEEIGQGRHPVGHLSGVLAERPFLVAHVNDADDAAIEVLARTGASVAYCPRASAYFGAERRFGPHRYREMMAAGVRVALGTDSIVNLDTPGRMSVLDDMRLLWRRDGVEARVLLEMGTINGAAALGLNLDWFRLGSVPHSVAGLVAVEVGDGKRGSGGNPLDSVMQSSGEPELLLHRNYCCDTRMEPI